MAGGRFVRSKKRAQRRRVATKKVKEMARTWKNQPPPTRTTRAKKEDAKIEKSFGFLFFVSLIGLVLLGLFGFQILKLRNRHLHRRGLRHVELPEWNATDDVEMLRSRYFESNRDEVRSVA
ncbi:unnamed protein product [Bathycoccus prasinos]